MIPGMVDYNGYTLADAKQSVGEGWSALLDRLWPLIPPEVIVVQVKEKYAELRVYVETPAEGFSSEAYNAVYPALDDASQESRTICETCGAPGIVRSRGHWLMTRCDVHAPAVVA